MNLPRSQAARIEAPLVVGVTGHRDLRAEDLPHLEQKVKRIFARLRKHHGATPLLILSPLAEGADRLVARVGLESGARLIVPLPMSAGLYEDDFGEPGSVDQFRTLLASAEFSFVVANDADPNTIAQPGPARNRCYELAGAYVVSKSQILIALWDGTESGKVGGTSAMVKLRTEGLRDDRDCNLGPPELFPVYHILTPRRSNPNPNGEAYRLREIYPPVFHREERGKSYYAKELRNLDQFNRHIATDANRLRDEAAESKRTMLGESHTAMRSLDQVLALDHYAVADALAIRFHRKTVRTHEALHLLVFASFSCLVCFAELGEFRVYWLVASLLLLAAAVLTHQVGRRRSFDDQSQDYRAVAEGARIRFFWKVAGISDSVADNYLEEQRTELDWIRNALRAWDAGSPPPAGTEDEREALGFALKHWVNHQRRYFSKAARDNRERAELIEGGVTAAVFLAIAIAVGIAIAAALDSGFRYGWWDVSKREWLKSPMIAIDLLLAAGALLHHFGERMAYSAHAKQYRRMEEIYRSAHWIIQEKLAAHDFAGARNCLRKLGREALAENGDWVLLHRERPLELPHP